MNLKKVLKLQNDLKINKQKQQHGAQEMKNIRLELDYRLVIRFITDLNIVTNIIHS